MRPCVVTDGGATGASLLAFPTGAQRDAYLRKHGAPGHYAADFHGDELLHEEFATCIHHTSGVFRPWACLECRIDWPAWPAPEPVPA